MTVLAERPLLLAAAVLYAAVVVAIGLWATRRTRDSRDFFLAGQRLGLLVTALATMSAAFSGFVFLGGPGLTYRMGIASLFICVPVGITSTMLCFAVAGPLRRLADDREVLTVPEAIGKRFESRAAAALSAVAVLVGTIGYLGAQLLALGVLIEPLLGRPAGEGLPVAMAIGTVVVLSYAVGGGMLAGVYTDVAQGAMMMVAAVAVFVHALGSAGGVSRIVERIADSPAFGAGFLDPLGGAPIATTAGFFLVFSVGVLGQPQMLHKLFMLRDPARLRFLPLVLGGSQVLCLLIWVGLGLAVPALVAGGGLTAPAAPDGAAPAYLFERAPQLLSGLVFAAALAAIMSTADSFVNLGAAALVRDLPRALLRPLHRELAWARLATVGLACVAAAFAHLYGDLIALLGTFAFGTFAAALAPTLAIGLNWRRVDAVAACASIGTGLVVNLGLELWAKRGGPLGLPPLPLPPGTLPSAIAVLASFVVLFTVSLARRPRPPAPLPVPLPRR